MPKVSDAHREARRRQILTATVRALAVKGVGSVSMADIITEAGLSAGAIYGHFDGKRELIAAVAREVLSRRRADLAAATAETPLAPGDVLTLLLRGALADGVDPRALLQFWAEAAVDDKVRAAVTESAVGVLREGLGGALRGWLGEHPEHAPDGVEAASVRLLPVMLGLAQGFLVQTALFDDFDGDAYLAAARELLPH
jgi:AcrR family transcriptional regulator